MSNIDHPDHYNTGEIECIDAIEAALGKEGLKTFCAGNALKYIWRYAHKGDPLGDLQKAQWYLDRLTHEVQDDMISHPVLNDVNNFFQPKQD